MQQRRKTHMKVSKAVPSTMRQRVVAPFPTNGSSAPSKRRNYGPRERKPPRVGSLLVLCAGMLVLAMLVFSILLSTNRLALTAPHLLEPQTAQQHNHHGIISALAHKPLLLTTTSPKSREYCKYEGHCLQGKTCVYDTSSPSGGVCEPYMETLDVSISSSSWLQDCESACKRDIELDERFYFKFKPKFGKTYAASSSEGRPDACIVTFERQRHYKDDYDVEEWRRSLKHVLVRLDPFSNSKNNQWAGLCYRTCTTDEQCVPKGFVANDEDAPVLPFTCQQGVCQRRQPYWQSENQSDEMKKDLVIVTGVTSSFFGGLENLAASLRYWAPHLNLVIYNLGMSQSQITEAESWHNVLAVEWKDGGIPKQYPEHVHVGKKYAWKPLIINETLHKYKKIFWTDAGSTITGPLDPLERIIERTGSFLVWGQDTDMTPRAHEGTFAYLNKNKSDYKDWSHFAGGIQGHLFPSRYVEPVVKRGAACALIKDCIDPVGSSLGNHRYDQTVLSILAHSPNIKAWHHTEYLAADQHQLNRNLSLPSDRIIWTSRQKCHYYADLIGSNL